MVQPDLNGPGLSSLFPGSAANSRLLGIEGLRAVATLCVVVLHAWLYASPGGETISFGDADIYLRSLKAGVTLFFTLSGFLLFRPFAEALLSGSSRPSTASYLRNRALRILPAYWVVLVLVTFVFQVARLDIVTGEIGVLSASAILANVLLVQNYSPSTIATGIGPAWSLAVEMVFYLVLPLLATAAWTLAGKSATYRRRLVAAIIPAVFLLLVGITGKLVAIVMTRVGLGEMGVWDQNWYNVLMLSFWQHADLFTYGMLVAVLHAHIQVRKITPPSWWRIAAVASIAATFGLVPLAWVVLGRLPQVMVDPLTAVLCGILLLLVVIPSQNDRQNSLLVRLLEWKPLAGLGIISYSVFLWNEPLALWLARTGMTFGGKPGVLLNCLIVISAATLLGVLTYKAVEKPALKLKSLKLAGRASLGTPKNAYEVGARS